MPFVSEISKVVAKYYLISPVMLKCKRRDRKYVKARQMVCAFSRDDSYTASEIGKCRSSVVLARKTIMNNMEFNSKLRKEYQEIEKQILLNEIS